MPLASCNNCVHSQVSGCELGLAPDKGEILCKKYSMTVGFREEILKVMREELQKETSRAVLQVRLRKMEESTAFAG